MLLLLAETVALYSSNAISCSFFEYALWKQKQKQAHEMSSVIVPAWRILLATAPPKYVHTYTAHI